MPETAGGTTLVICTAQGLSTIILDHDGKPVEQTKEDGSEHETAPCIFGATAHYFAPDFGESHLVRFAEFDRLLLVRSDSRLFRVALGPRAIATFGEDGSYRPMAPHAKPLMMMT